MKTQNNLEKFFSAYKTKHYKRGEIIINEDDNPEGIYYLVKGFVKMNSIYEDGSELTLNIFKPGTFFPMIWAINDIKNTYVYQALSDVEVHQTPREKVLEFLEGNPDISFDLLKRILVGMDGLVKNFPELLFGNSKKRVLAVLSMLSKRFGEKKEGGVLIKIRLTHHEIASMTGLTRETTSLTLKTLEREGVIGYKDKLILIKELK